MKFDVVKALSALESIAVIGGIVFAVWQVLEISKQTTIQADTLKQSQQIASADLVLKLRATLDDNKFVEARCGHSRSRPQLPPSLPE
jgi:hypothetical protein